MAGDGMERLEKGNQLAIPFARAHRPRSSTAVDESANMLRSPRDARNEGGAGVYFCPVCEGRLDARVMGEVRAPYFAHAHGVGVNCAWRGSGGDGSYGYVALPRAEWQRNHLEQIQRRTMNVEVRLKGGRAYLAARGSPTTLDSLGLDPDSAVAVRSTGTRQEVRLATVAMQRSEFAVAIADPLEAEIRLVSPDGRPVCRWSLDVTQTERSERCIAFVTGADGVGRPVSTLSELPGDLQLLFQGTANGTIIVPSSQSDTIRGAVRSARTCTQVLEAQGWYVAQRPWDDEAREVVRTLGAKPLSVRRLLRVTPLSGVSYRGASTVVQPTDVKTPASFWIQPSLVDDLDVEIIPIPYKSKPTQSLSLDRTGKILQMELENGEDAADCYILALDPLNPGRILGDVRLAVLSPPAWKAETQAVMESEDADGDWSIPLGVIVGDEEPQTLSCVESPACVVNFKPNQTVAGVPRLETARLHGPTDFLTRPEFLSTVTLEKNGGPISTPRILSTARLATLDELRFTLSLFAADDECTSVTIRFGALGSVRLARHQAVRTASRCSSRVRILAALLARPPSGKHIGRGYLKELLGLSSPTGSHGWESEVRRTWRVIRRGRTPDERISLGLAYLSTYESMGPDAFNVEPTVDGSLHADIQRRVDELGRAWTAAAAEVRKGE
jgi:hypothetical protein